MKFDPTKKHGLVSGQSTLFPNAKFEQNGHVYDASHKCLNPTEGVSKEPDTVTANTPPPPPPVIKEDVAAKLKKLQKTLTESAEKLQKATAAAEISSTAAKKSQVTKATKAYDKAFDELEKFKLDSGID